MTKAKRLLQWLLRCAAGAALAAAMYYLVWALATGKVPPRFQIFVMDGWVLIFLCMWVLVQRYWERQFLGSTWKQPFMLQPGEEPVFSSNRVGCLLYPRAEDYSPRVPLRVLASEKKPFLGGPYLKLRLTDRRLMLRSWWGNTWRIVPVSSIERVTEAPRRISFSLCRVVISYRLEGHSEVLVIEDKCVKGRTLKEALLALTRFTGGVSGPSSSNLANETLDV
jgi:hypothetical protein